VFGYAKHPTKENTTGFYDLGGRFNEDKHYQFKAFNEKNMAKMVSMTDEECDKYKLIVNENGIRVNMAHRPLLDKFTIEYEG
jgi:hypothetical protein